jgi:hypothetical protein
MALTTQTSFAANLICADSEGNKVEGTLENGKGRLQYTLALINEGRTFERNVEQDEDDYRHGSGISFVSRKYDGIAYRLVLDTDFIEKVKSEGLLVQETDNPWGGREYLMNCEVL